MFHLVSVTAMVLLFTACKTKEKKDAVKFVSVQSLIEQQAAHIDTSLYSIRKIVTHDSLHSDTSFIAREKFREAAKEFLEIPDLSDPKIARRFKEESRYDTLIKRVIITYIPLDAQKEEIKKQELVVSTQLDNNGYNKVTNIIVDRVINNRDGFKSQQMLWRMDKSFLIITTTQKPGEPEVATTTKVAWNEEDLQ